MKTVCVIVLGIVLLSAAHAGQAKQLPPDPLKPDVSEAYGPDPANVFDLWLAKSADNKPTPLMLFIHGGGFMAGSYKNVDRNMRDLLLKNGISYASLEYRFSQVAKYPAPMHDCARALQYIRHHAAKWNIDPKRVASSGGSAGAGISMWLAFHDDLADPKSDDPVARQSTRLTCIQPDAGQCTYDPREIKKIVPGGAERHPALRQLHGLPKDFDWEKDPIDEQLDKMLKDCSPITHLTKDDAPVFQVHNAAAEKDGDIHHPNFGRHLEAEMKKLGIECISRIIDRAKPDGRNRAEEILAFLKRQFGM